jgi:RTX calcium-binding nonapeptide repeat (4 copies)
LIRSSDSEQRSGSSVWLAVKVVARDSLEHPQRLKGQKRRLLALAAAAFQPRCLSKAEECDTLDLKLNYWLVHPRIAAQPPESTSIVEDAFMALINGTNLNDILVGTNVADNINGLGGNDVLIGLAGSDILDGGAGADTMIGGAGNDLYFVDNVGDVVAEALNEGLDRIQTSISLSLNVAGKFDVENLTLSGAAVTGFGNSLANRIVGNNLANNLNGLGGNDILARLRRK